MARQTRLHLSGAHNIGSKLENRRKINFEVHLQRINSEYVRAPVVELTALHVTSVTSHGEGYT